MRHSTALGPLWLRLAQLVCAGLIALKLAQLLLAGPFMDETYYWMWGQHPALSYYDHPPLNAWMLGLSERLFGWNVFALRLPVALSFFADIGALALVARRVAGPAWRDLFVVSLLLFLVTPMYWMVASYALPDHLLMTGCLYAIVFFHRFFADRAAGGAGRSADLYLGALFLGLAALSKYNAAFLAIGLVLFILVRDRRLLAEGRLYLAGLLTLVLQAPVVAWNASEGFASWMFILRGRHSGLGASIDGVLPFVLAIVLLLSPFLLWPMLRFVIRGREVPGSGFARATFIVSTLAILAVSLVTQTLFHWNLVAYAAMLPFLALFVRPRWLLPLQAIYGIAFAVAAFVNYAVQPITDIDGWSDKATAWSYGWSDTAQAVRQAAEAHHASFVATPDYTTASLLGFAMADPDVVSLSPRTDQYDYWFDAAAHAGDDAILLDDRWQAMPASVAARFASVEQLQALEVWRGGRLLDTHRIYLARGFRPDG